MLQRVALVHILLSSEFCTLEQSQSECWFIVNLGCLLYKMVTCGKHVTYIIEYIIEYILCNIKQRDSCLEIGNSLQGQLVQILLVCLFVEQWAINQSLLHPYT